MESSKITLLNFVEDALTDPCKEWEVQGLGMLRTYIGDTRLTVWHHDLKTVDTADIHNHPWWLFSDVVCGRIDNTRYGTTWLLDKTEPINGFETHVCRKIVTGSGDPRSEDRLVRLWQSDSEQIFAGFEYVMSPIWIHKTEFLDGTVTLMRKEMDNQPNTAEREAYVFWPIGTEFKSAEPYRADSATVLQYTAHALELLHAQKKS